MLTAASLAVVTGLSAVVGIVIAREFGRGPETDGFFAAYGVFLVLVLAGTSLRVAVLPPLARARNEGRFDRELGSFAVAIGVVAVPALVLALVADGWIGAQLTGGLPAPAAQTAAETLRFMVPAALAQVFAALAASGLAAHDSYGTAAAAYAAGSIVGLAAILLLVEEHGIAACAWGMALNGAVVLGVTSVALVARVGPPRFAADRIRHRLATLARSIALPLVLQGIFVVCLTFAGDLGTGAITSFTYAYLIGSALVAVAASSLGLVSSVPLARLELDDRAVSNHVVRMSWLAFAAVAAAAGVFALVGDRAVAAVLGASYGGATGDELGRLVALLALWMAVSIGVTVTFPLLFVVARERRLPLVAVAALALHVVVAWGAIRTWGLDGAALALTVTTLAILVSLLALVSAAVLVRTARGLALAALVTGGAAAIAFAAADVLLSGAAAAAAGVVLFVLLLLATRSLGLRDAWAYLRALG